jgi:hypothetical protein
MGCEVDHRLSLQFLKLLYSITGGLIYLVAVMTACSKCNQTSTILRILKCVFCFNPVCEKCAIRRYGQRFCSEDCAKSFFVDEYGDLDRES